MTETAEQIADRYGAALAPGVAVQKIPRGASSRPLPVWDGRKLIVPDWKEERERAKRASLRAVRCTKAAQRRAEVRRLHGEGCTMAQIQAALGITYRQVKNDLYHLGLRAHVDHAAISDKLRDVANQRAAERLAMVARMIEEGADEAAITAALGVTDRSWARRMIRRVKPDFPFQNRRRGGVKGKPLTVRRGPTKAQREMAAKINRLLAQGLDRSAIRDRLGLTHGAVQGHFYRLAKAGLLVEPDPERVAA